MRFHGFMAELVDGKWKQSELTGEVNPHDLVVLDSRGNAIMNGADLISKRVCLICGKKFGKRPNNGITHRGCN